MLSPAALAASHKSPIHFYPIASTCSFATPPDQTGSRKDQTALRTRWCRWLPSMECPDPSTNGRSSMRDSDKAPAVQTSPPLSATTTSEDAGSETFQRVMSQLHAQKAQHAQRSEGLTISAEPLYLRENRNRHDAVFIACSHDSCKPAIKSNLYV